MDRRLVGTILGALLLVSPVSAQSTADPFASLSFLLGTWNARAVNNPSVVASGTYSFRAELNRHIIARHTIRADCKGPEDFNCQHGDLLYIYADASDQPLRAIYFDNEGHVIHYSVSTPTSTTAEFISDRVASGPQFRLIYELQGGVMNGKFQIRMPESREWKSYLEWTGSRSEANQTKTQPAGTDQH